MDASSLDKALIIHLVITSKSGCFILRKMARNETSKRDFYRPQRSCGKVIFSQTSVSHSVHGGVSAWVHAGVHPQAGTLPGKVHPLGRCTPGQVHPRQYTPGQVHLLDRYTPPGRYTPWAGTPPPRRSLQQTVHILLGCFLVHNVIQLGVHLFGTLNNFSVNFEVSIFKTVLVL